jgi:IMP cyclohydrolase
MYQTAKTHFDRHLCQNPYPGRGLVIGRSSDDDAWLMVYWIMGRSAHSQNRRFVAQGATLRTEPVDPGKVADPSLIIYDAMLELNGVYWVSNGDQTRTLYEAMQEGKAFEVALATREREPDPPNYTPRISAMLDLRQPTAQVALNILKANPVDPAFTDHFTFRPAPPPPGLGLCLTTYMGDGSPLPSFRGEPLYMPCQGDIQTVLDTYWAALDTRNRISIAVKQIPFDQSPSTIVLYNRFPNA